MKYGLPPVENVSGVSSTSIRLIRIPRGENGTVEPFCNYWESVMNTNLKGGKALWTGLSDCNIFLENIDKPFDLLPTERDRWIGEALFVKAYLHFWLFRQYGPIPLIKENLPLSLGTEEIQRYREPVDQVADYIVELLDSAAELLPLTIENATEEMGRPDKCIALALKAQVLTYAASPLFNCNEDYADFTDSRGVQLFPQDKSQEKAKWQRAAIALKEAIDVADEGMHQLYDFRKYFPGSASLDEKTVLAMQVRGAVTERWNNEIIFGSLYIGYNTTLQRFCMPYWNFQQKDFSSGLNLYAPTLRMVEQFYTKNGVPIEEDKEWTGRDLWELRTATANDRQYIKEGFPTANIHFDREARFYGSIMFDGGTFYGNNRINQDNTADPNYLWVTELNFGGLQGAWDANRFSVTGYLCKKLIHYRTSTPETTSGFTNYAYAFPVIRLADLYLMYAEALNEAKDVPDTEVYEYIDLVRVRTGLAGVVESWRDHALDPGKPATKEGMREIIRRERMNELAFEGPRFWDLRRWKLAEEYMNRPVRGLNIRSITDFYQVQEIFPLAFEKKDYLWPISTDIFLSNQHLMQNPGW